MQVLDINQTSLTSKSPTTTYMDKRIENEQGLKKRIITASTHIGPKSHKEMKKEMGVFEKELNRFLSKNGVFSQPRGIEMLKGIRRNKKRKENPGSAGDER